MPNKKYGKKVTIINRGPRSTPDETQTVIDGIPALKGLFHRMHNKFELSGKIDSAEVKDKPEYDPEAVGDVVGGMMYLSRLHSGVWGGQKKLSDYEEKNMHAQYGVCNCVWCGVSLSLSLPASTSFSLALTPPTIPPQRALTHSLTPRVAG